MIENDNDKKIAERKAHFAALVEQVYEMERASGKGATNPWDFFWNEIPDDEDELEDLDEGVDNDALEIKVEPEKKLRKSKKSVVKPRSK